jgi:hypothetical protein
MVKVLLTRVGLQKRNLRGKEVVSSLWLIKVSDQRAKLTLVGSSLIGLAIYLLICGLET